jgi:hypothetical protein
VGSSVSTIADLENVPERDAVAALTSMRASPPGGTAFSVRREALTPQLPRTFLTFTTASDAFLKTNTWDAQSPRFTSPTSTFVSGRVSRPPAVGVPADGGGVGGGGDCPSTTGKGGASQDRARTATSEHRARVGIVAPLLLVRVE